MLTRLRTGRLLIGGSGIHTRMMRIHRPFMVRGYKEPERFGRSTKTCVESALKVLELLRRMDDLNAPYTAACESFASQV